MAVYTVMIFALQLKVLAVVLAGEGEGGGALVLRAWVDFVAVTALPRGGAGKQRPMVCLHGGCWGAPLCAGGGGHFPPEKRS